MQRPARYGILQFSSPRWILAAALSTLAAVAILALAGWTLSGSGGGPTASAVQIIPPAGAEPAPGAGIPPAAQPTPPASTRIAVYITGAVVNPGVYAATAGQRLDAVVALAGGAAPDADLNRVNLAAYVTDAAHYRIPARREPASGAAPPASEAAASSPACAAPVDINSATAECLATLPGIGSVRADSIVAHREQAGPFATADGIVAVSGIGNGIYQRIAGLITVSPR